MKQFLIVTMLIALVATGALAQGQAEQKVFLSDTVKNSEVLTSSTVTHKGEKLAVWVKSAQANDSIKTDLYYRLKFGGAASDTTTRVLLDSCLVAHKKFYVLDFYPGAAVTFISVGRSTGNAIAGTKNTLTITAGVR